jgi:hypothetical protein
MRDGKEIQIARQKRCEKNHNAYKPFAVSLRLSVQGKIA